MIKRIIFIIILITMTRLLFSFEQNKPFKKSNIQLIEINIQFQKNSINKTPMMASMVEPLIYLFFFGVPIAVSSVGLISMITSIPLLSVGLYYKTYDSEKYHDNYIISGGLCLGLGALFFIPSFIILMYSCYNLNQYSETDNEYSSFLNNLHQIKVLQN